jgi:hypothetical protein
LWILRQEEEVMSKLTEVFNATEVMVSWLGDGGVPVGECRSEHRASICRKCPMNKPDDWWAWKPKSKAASIIRRSLEMKNRFSIRVPKEQELGTCLVCGCCLLLKVHVPLEHIQASITTGQMSEFQIVNCWIYQETQTP